MKIEKLTAAQTRAVNSDAEEILCVAGPGSGKTTVLTERIARIVREGGRPEEIVAITYTNAAARNLEDRLVVYDAAIEKTKIRLGYCGTLHGFALRMLKRHGQADGYGERTAIIDEDASRELIEAQAKTLGCKTTIDKLMKLKAEGRPKGPNLSTDQLVVIAYVEEMAEGGLLDFDLILTEFYRLLVTQPGLQRAIEADYANLFVDEVQDSALADWKIYRTLPIANKFLVGDPDQAIFGFRGGDQALMRNYAQSGGVEICYLTENFRCREEICEAANRIIRNNTGRLDKFTVSGVGTGGRVIPFGQTVNEGDEIAQVLGYIQHIKCEPGEMAILARTNAIAAQFREAIKAAGIEVAEPPKSTLPADWGLARAIIEMMAQPHNDTLAYFYCIAKAKSRGASDKEARQAADLIRNNARAKGQRINHGWAGTPPTVMDVPQALDRDQITGEARMIIGEMIQGLPSGAGILELSLEAARVDKAPATEPPGDGITVTTIHAAKGREWNIVFLVGYEDEVTPGTGKSADIEEERRLGFVALTRARNSVYISHAASRKASWGPKPIQKHNPSRFLKEILP